MFRVNCGLFTLLALVAGTFAKQNVEIQPRIILGQEAVRAQFPYFVFIEVDTTVLRVNNFYTFS